MKLKWKVQQKETGNFSSFHKRGWPNAYYENGEYAGGIYCNDSYSLNKVKSGNHGLLSVRFFDRSGNIPKSLLIEKRFLSLQDAKDSLQEILDKYPHFIGNK